MKVKFFDKLMEGVFFLAALASIIFVFLIAIFIFMEGLPGIFEIGLGNFLLGMDWSPSNLPPSFGIFPMIIGSLYVSGLALLFGVPIGLLTAIYLAEFAPKKFYPYLKAGVNLMAGIPSIVYGFFGLVVLVPLVKDFIGGNGNSVLTAGVLLAIMILPTIIGLSEASLRAVPRSYYEGGIALGASKERTIFTLLVRGGKSGIISSIILALGRALGETMAVVMVAGNQTLIPKSLLKGTRTLTSNIIIELGYAADLHRQALIGTGVVLFVFILLTNASFHLIKRRWTK